MCFNRDVSIAPHLFGRINNNEAPGNDQAILEHTDGKFIITSSERMKCHRSSYYTDNPKESDME